MADDVVVLASSQKKNEASTGSAQGLRRGSSYEERLQEMRRHLRQQQEKMKRCELRQKAKQEEMAESWVEYKAEQQRLRDEELRQRLSREKTNQERATARKVAGLAKLSNQREQGGALPAPNGCKTEAVCQLASGSLADVPKSPTLVSAGADALGVPEPAVTTAPEAVATTGAVICGLEALAKKPGMLLSPKKKRDERTPAEMAKGKSSQGERNVMQHAQEQFQGLKKSADGRAIIDAGTKQQRTHREALVKLDRVAVDRCEKEAEVENGRTDEEKKADPEQHELWKWAENGQMARRYRLRNMRQVTGQVFQCRKTMAAQLESFCGSGLGCSTQGVIQRPPSSVGSDCSNAVAMTNNLARVASL